jgi:hypothetical protein
VHGLPLAAAQHEIAANWYAAWVSAGRPTHRTSATAPLRSRCAALTGAGPVGGRRRLVSASAVYNSSYGDYDVYVHSNQPDQTVIASGGAWSKSWHTDRLRREGSTYAR